MADIYNPDIQFPIEGHTVWPNLMRLIIIGTTVVGVLFSLVLILLLPPEHLHIDPPRLMTGIFGFVIFEVLVVRLLIIPAGGDYGRYRINQGNVEYYPLSTLGMHVEPRGQIIPMTDFKGLSVQTHKFRDGVTRSYVSLLHPRVSNSIRIRLFGAEGEAKAFAESLSARTGVEII